MLEYDFDNELAEQIKNNYLAVQDKINVACKNAGRDSEEVTLIGVSKVFPVAYAEAAFCSGLCNLGENRVQELVPKIERFEELNLEANWHLIGTLQKNKVKYIIGKTKMIHSVDSLGLAEEISKRSEANGIKTNILIQTNVSREESKHGFDSDTLKETIESLNSLNGINVCGMMTMAPIQQYEGQAREVFSKTREIFDELSGYVSNKELWNTLSMGMSQDYIDAISEGSTHIRIGTSIFGDRSKVCN